jgi:hypothetical protein
LATFRRFLSFGAFFLGLLETRGTPRIVGISIINNNKKKKTTTTTAKGFCESRQPQRKDGKISTTKLGLFTFPLAALHKPLRNDENLICTQVGRRKLNWEFRHITIEYITSRVHEWASLF